MKTNHWGNSFFQVMCGGGEDSALCSHLNENFCNANPYFEIP